MIIRTNTNNKKNMNKRLRKTLAIEFAGSRETLCT